LRLQSLRQVTTPAVYVYAREGTERDKMPFDFKKYDEKCQGLTVEELQREWQHYTVIAHPMCVVSHAGDN
jgi:hypothetical protein